MSCWFHVTAFFISVHFFICRSHSFSTTCSSKSLPGCHIVSSQAWLNILRLPLCSSTVSKSLKFIVSPSLLMLNKENVWNMISLPVSIGTLFLDCVSSKTWIFLLNSARIIFMIPGAIFESWVSISNSWCLSNTNLEGSGSSMRAATSNSANQSTINRRWVDPDFTSRWKDIFQDLDLDACGQGSNSNFSASFDVEELLSATDRVSHRSWEVDGMCFHGLHSSGRDACNGKSTISFGVKGCERYIPGGRRGTDE